MGQHEILKILKDNPNKKYSTKELAKLVGIGRDVLNNNLRPMRIRNEVKSEMIYDNAGKHYLYSHNKTEE